jgi:DNA-binding NarL/FixJ family response regulator
LIPEPVDDQGPPQLRALVVDDFEPFRRVVCSALVEQLKAEIVGEAEDGLEAFYKFGRLKPNLVVLDLNLPKLNGLELAKSIRITLSDCRILLCTVVADVEVMDEAFRCGVDAYLIKTGFLKELRPAMRAVLQGKKYASPRILRGIKEQ